MCLGVSVGLRVLDSREGPWLLEGQPLTAPSSGVPREQRNRPETWVELGWAVGGSAGVSLTPALWNSPRQPGGGGGGGRWPECAVRRLRLHRLGWIVSYTCLQVFIQIFLLE